MAAESLSGAVADHANRVHRLLDSSGRGELAERLRAEADRWEAQDTTVVVVGETKRGKSSLVNALVGEPDLLPVGTDVVTASHVAVRYARDLRGRVVRLDGSTEEFPVEEVARYVSVEGDPAIREAVQAVEVGVPHPLLARRLVVVDTPGVGGLRAGHTEVTLAALALSDALVFVLDASAPITRPELDFLARAAERVAAVVFVVTKTDAYRGWREILDEDRKLVAMAAPRFADSPFVPVSSRLRLQAAFRDARGDTERAARLTAHSGFAALESELGRFVARRELVRLANVLQVTASTTAWVEESERAELAALGDAPTAQEDLEARREELAASAAAGARWRSEVAGSFQRLQLELNQEVTRRFTLLQVRFEAMASESGANLKQVLASASEQLDYALQSTWVELMAFTAERLRIVAEDLGRTLEVPGVDVSLPHGELPDVLHHVTSRPGATFQGASTGDLLKIGAPTVITGSMLGNVIGGLAVGMFGLVAAPAAVVGAASVGLGMAVAGAMNRGNVRAAARARDLQEYTRLVREALQVGKSEVSQELGLRLVTTRQELEASIEELITDRRREIERRAKELTRLAKAEQAERERAAAEAETRAAAVTRLHQEALALQRRVLAALQQPVKSPPPPRRPDVTPAAG